jgi:hypothetical protein
MDRRVCADHALREEVRNAARAVALAVLEARVNAKLTGSRPK